MCSQHNASRYIALLKLKNPSSTFHTTLAMPIIDFLLFATVKLRAAPGEHLAKQKTPERTLKPRALAIDIPEAPTESSIRPNLCKSKEIPHSHLLKCGHLVETLHPNESCGPSCTGYVPRSSVKLKVAFKQAPCSFLCRTCVAEEVEKKYHAWKRNLKPYDRFEIEQYQTPTSLLATANLDAESYFSCVFLDVMTLEEVWNIESERRLSQASSRAGKLRDVKMPLHPHMDDGERRLVERYVRLETEVEVSQELQHVIERLEAWKKEKDGGGTVEGDRKLSKDTGVPDLALLIG